MPPKYKKRTNFGNGIIKTYRPPMSKDDEELDIFDWIGAEDLLEEEPAEVTGLREVCSYTATSSSMDSSRSYDAPEFRVPGMPVALTKNNIERPFLDQDFERKREFNVDVVRAVKEWGPDDFDLSKVDVVTSMSFLRMMVGFVDETFQENMEARGCHTRKSWEAEPLDLGRITRTPEAPDTVFLGSVWRWEQSGGTETRLTYDGDFIDRCTGDEVATGVPQLRTFEGPYHYRLVEYNIGGLRCLVQIPVRARVPLMDEGDVAGHTVEMDTESIPNRQRFWDRQLASKYALMKLLDIGMYVRGILTRGALNEVEEHTRADLELDRPEMPHVAADILGKVGGLLRRLREIANCPGGRDRIMYVNYSDCELRVISPRMGKWTMDRFIEDWEDDFEEKTVPPEKPKVPVWSYD